MLKDDSVSIASRFLKYFEGFRSEPYDDGTGTITQGYGTVYRFNGTKVRIEDPPVTELQALAEMQLTLGAIFDDLAANVPRFRNKPDYQIAALLAFAYTIPLFRGRTDTIDRYLFDGQWAKIPSAFPMYRNKGSDLELGLLRRQLAAKLLWLVQYPGVAIDAVKGLSLEEIYSYLGLPQ